MPQKTGEEVMNKMTLMVALATAVLFTGCVTTDSGEKKNFSYNMQQATWRSGGDLSMTALLDSGVDKTEAVNFANAIAAFVEDGTITKELFKAKVLSVAPFGYSDYIDALFSVIPSEVSLNEKIPENVRIGLSSFLKDGAIRGAELYNVERRAQ